MNQKERENGSNLAALYQNRFKGNAQLQQKDKIWTILCEDFFNKYLNENDILVDVAAGYCEFINHAKAGRKIAFDLNPDTIHFAEKDVEVYNASVFDLEKYLKDLEADVFFASNFLEHLDSKADILDLFQMLTKKLSPNGRIMVLQPNIRYVKEAYWDFIDHKMPLTDAALTELAEMNGLKVVKCIKKFLPYTTKSAIPKDSWLISLYLKLMPFSGWVMGKQTFMIMQKCD